MTWLILSLTAPFLWSIANYVDKYILSKTATESGGSGGLVILSSLVSLITAGVVLLVFGVNSIQLNMQSSIVLILAGIFEVLYIYFYFLSLEIESTSTVIALFQFAPVFGVIFGVIFLGEIPTTVQFFAIALILVGTLCLVVRKNEFHFKIRVLKLMGLSTLFVGLYNTLFKVAGESIPFWTAVFWEYLGIVIAGILFFIFSKKYQKQFFGMLKRKSIILTSTAELLNVGAVMVTNAAIVLAPVGLVLSVSSIQPLFVLAEGFLLYTFLPRFFSEEKPNWGIQYVVGFVLVIVGGFMIY